MVCSPYLEVDVAANPKTIKTNLTGWALIESFLINKGTAFTEEERQRLGLRGLLPPHVDALEEQVARAYEAFSGEPTRLNKHVFLRQIQDENETLFYRLLLEHIEEMMPIVYTPVVGQACEQFSHIYRRPRGLFLSYPEREAMDEIFNGIDRKIDIIVVTDGERILGLGDQGAGGMGIPIGKLSLYTVCGGIHPARTLPILLDCGTNNTERLQDPRYLGWRHTRIKGSDYDSFVKQFVQAVSRRFPEVLLQWEDFASADAHPILERYRDQLCTFNDDIQGTAAVATGTILAAVGATGGNLADQRIVMLGAGSAGIGITDQLLRNLVRGGMSLLEARKRLFLVDIHGLVHQGRPDLSQVQRKLAHPVENLSAWDCDLSGVIDLADVVRNVHPTVLLGATGQSGAFSEMVVREMARHVERPIIFPLSNPTSCVEATPTDLICWTDGRALVATGSPFEPVKFGGESHHIAQCNNSYIFPAMGLAVLAARVRRVTDEMFMVAGVALKEKSPKLKNVHATLLPPWTEIRSVTRHIARAVAVEAQQQGVAEATASEELERRIDQEMWRPEYVHVERLTGLDG